MTHVVCIATCLKGPFILISQQTKIAMSLRAKSRRSANFPIDAGALTVNEKILRECHMLYIDADGGKCQQEQEVVVVVTTSSSLFYATHFLWFILYFA